LELLVRHVVHAARAETNDPADGLMSHDAGKRRLDAQGPLLHMDIGAADAGQFHLDQDATFLDLRDVDLHNLQRGAVFKKHGQPCMFSGFQSSFRSPFAFQFSSYALATIFAISSG
jgi:hypothetical protein